MKPAEGRRLWWATLFSGSPRYTDWRRILGSDDVPLMSAGSGNATLGNESVEVYLLDLSQLSPEQFDRLVMFVANKFRATPAEMRDGIMQEGFPIRAADVTVAFDMRAFL